MNRIIILSILAAILLAGCGRKQAAIGAANIREAADAILAGADPMPAATGIKTQAVAIHQALGPETQPTVPAQAWVDAPEAAVDASNAQAKAIDDEAATWNFFGGLLDSAWGWVAGAFPVLGGAALFARNLIGKWKGIAGNGIALAQRAKKAAEEALKVAGDSEDPAIRESAQSIQANLDAALAAAKAWQEEKGVRGVVDHIRREVQP
jgi:hypothetical protein